MRPFPLQLEKTFLLQDLPKTLMGKSFASDFHDDLFSSGKTQPSAGLVLGLVSSVPVATKIAAAARKCHLQVHNASRAASLLQHLQETKPVMMFLDFDGCEAEAFRLLEALKTSSQAAKFPIFGFVSQSKRSVKEEAQRAGCDRVYFKTDFLTDLENLLARSAL